MPLELRNAIGLGLLGLLAPLLLLYLLKGKREVLRISAAWLWASAQRDLLVQRPFRRLVLQLPLLLQALALLALSGALSQPATRTEALLVDHVAIVVDTSASMLALTATGATRLEQARHAAHELVDSLGPGADALVVEAGPTPFVAAPLDRDRRRLHAAIDALKGQEARGRLAESLALAADRLRRLPGAGKLVLITDGATSAADVPAKLALPTDVIQVADPVDNAAIIRMDVRRGANPSTQREEVQVFGVVANYGRGGRDLFVTLRPRNVLQPLASRRLHLAAGEQAPVVLTFEPAPADTGLGLILELSPSDVLAVDDRAFGRVPPGGKLPVVVAPPEASPWFVRALASDPNVEVLGTSLESLGTADVPSDSMVVVDGACPQTMPTNNFVILAPPPGPCHSATVGDEVEDLAVTSWTIDDARLRFLTLDAIRVRKARLVQVERAAASLVRGREGTVVADLSTPGQTGTLLAFDVAESNWPLSASFVIFARNLLEEARADRSRGMTGATKTGRSVSLRVPPDVTEATIVGPDEAESRAPARSGLLVLPDVSKAGFYYVSWGGSRPGSTLVPANLTDPEESDLRARALRPGSTLASATLAGRAPTYTEYGWLLALLALLFIAGDAWWLTRRSRAIARLPGPQLAARRRGGEPR